MRSMKGKKKARKSVTVARGVNFGKKKTGFISFKIKKIFIV